MQVTIRFSNINDFKSQLQYDIKQSFIIGQRICFFHHIDPGIKYQSTVRTFFSYSAYERRRFNPFKPIIHKFVSVNIFQGKFTSNDKRELAEIHEAWKPKVDELKRIIEGAKLQLAEGEIVHG